MVGSGPEEGPLPPYNTGSNMIWSFAIKPYHILKNGCQFEQTTYEVLQFNLIIILKKTIIFCSLSLGGKRSFFDTKSVWTFLYTFSEVHFIIFILCRLQKSVWVWTCQKWWSKEKFGKTRNNQWRSNNRQRNRREGWMGQQMQFFLVCVGICRYVSINSLNL